MAPDDLNGLVQARSPETGAIYRLGVLTAQMTAATERADRQAVAIEGMRVELREISHKLDSLAAAAASAEAPAKAKPASGAAAAWWSKENAPTLGLVSVAVAVVLERLGLWDAVVSVLAKAIGP